MQLFYAIFICFYIGNHVQSENFIQGVIRLNSVPVEYGHDIIFFEFVVKKDTIIDGDNYFITSTENNIVQVINFSNNSNVNYLISNLYHVFPSTIIYDATNCSIQQLTHLDFKGLYALQYIHLTANKIKALPRDIFKDNFLLQTVKLGFNQIKSIGLDLFTPLKYLKTINLFDNELEVVYKNFLKNNFLLEFVDLRRNLCFDFLYVFENVTLIDETSQCRTIGDE